MDKNIQFPSQTPEIAQRTEEIGHRIGRALSSLDLLYDAETYRLRTSENGKHEPEVYPHHEKHEDKPPLTDKERAQASLISEYLHTAVTSLPETADEDEVWDSVFEAQLTDFIHATKNSDDKDSLNTIGLSLLSTNLLATAHLDEQDSQVLLDRRFWRIARSEHGKKLLEVANENVGFCVATPKPQPGETTEQVQYQSVASHIQRFADIFSLIETENNGDMNYAFEPLENATIDDTRWLLRTLVDKGLHKTGFSSFKYINHDYKKTLASELIEEGWSPGFFMPTKYSSNKDSVVFTALEGIELIMHGDKPEDSINYFDSLTDPSEVNTALDLIQDEKLLLEAIQKIQHQFPGCVDTKFLEPLIGADLKPRLNVFSNLTFDQIRLIQESGLYHESEVLLAASSMDADCQRAYIQSLFDHEPPRSFEIAQHPELFTSFTIDELLTLFEANFSRILPVSLDTSTLLKWIPEFKESRIERLLDIFPESESGIIYVSLLRLRNDQPDETRWLYEQAQNSSTTTTLQLNLHKLKDVMNEEEQMALMERLVDPAVYSFLSRDTIALLDKIPATTKLEMLYRAGKFREITENIDYFAQTIDRQQLIGLLTETTDGLVAVAQNETLIKEVGPVEIFNRLKNTGKVEGILSNAPVLVEAGIPLESIIDVAIESESGIFWFFKTPGNSEILHAYGYENIFNKFTQAQKSHLLIHVLDEFESEHQQRHIVFSALHRGEYPAIILEAINGLDAVPDYMIQVRELLTERGETEFIFKYPALFFGGRKGGTFSHWRTNDSVQELIEKGAATSVVLNPYNFKRNEVRLALQQSIREGNIDIIANNFYIVENYLGSQPLDTDTTIAFARAGRGDLLMRFATIMGRPTEAHVLAMFERSASSSKEFYDHYVKQTGERLEWVETGLRLLGKDAPISAIFASREVLYGTTDNLPPHYSELGITRRGMQGIEQLRAAIPKIRTMFVDAAEGSISREQLQILRNNPIAKGYGKFLVRFSESDFGRSSEEEWTRIIDSVLSLPETSQQHSFTYASSELIDMTERDEEQMADIPIRPDVRDRFGALQDDIRYVLELVGHYTGSSGGIRPSNEINKRIVSVIEAETTSLRAQLSGQLPDKAREGITKRLHELEQALEDSLDSPLSMLASASSLSGIKVASEDDPNGKKISADHLFRKLALALAIEDDTSAVFHNAVTLRNVDASIDNIAFMQEFIDESVQNRLKTRFTESDQQFEKTFRKLLSTVAFQEQIVELSKIGYTADSTIQFMRTRGLMLELSGHFSDACWASRYDSINESAPNVSAVVMVKNRGKASERIVGSSLMIETVDQATGEPIVVIRGVNPIQNYVTAVDTERFLDSFLSFAKEIAGDKKVAIVLDGGSGGALTNRPSLYKAFMERFGQLRTTSKPINLPESSTFNGYRLSQEAGYPAYYI